MKRVALHAEGIKVLEIRRVDRLNGQELAVLKKFSNLKHLTIHGDIDLRVEPERLWAHVAKLKQLKTLLDDVNVEDKGCTEKVYRGLCAQDAEPGHLSHLERPNYDFAHYINDRIQAV